MLHQENAEQPKDLALINKILDNLNEYITKNPQKIETNERKRRDDIFHIASHIYTYSQTEVDVNALLTQSPPQFLPNISTIPSHSPQAFVNLMESLDQLLSSLNRGFLNRSQLATLILPLIHCDRASILKDMQPRYDDHNRKQNHETLSILPPELWLSILRFCQPKDLAYLSLSCSFFRPLTNDDAIWKALLKNNNLKEKMEKDKTKINITLKYLTGKKNSFSITSTAPIRKLAKKLYDKQGIPVEQLRFIHNGRNINPSEDGHLKLRDCDITDGNEIVYVTRLRGD